MSARCTEPDEPKERVMNDKFDFTPQLNRRTLLTGMAAASAATIMPSGARAQQGRVIFANYGGSWEQAMRRAWFEPFTKETGIQVVSASGNALGRLQAMVEAKRTEWDLVEGTPELARLGAERGLLEPLDFKVIDRSQALNRPELYSDYSVPEVTFGRLLIYNKKLGPITRDWTALFDVKKFPGKRALWNRAESGVLEIALLADGVPADKLYPLDVPRALKKLSEIRDHILWFETVTQSEQYMRDGQAVMGVLADGRAQNVIAAGADVEVVPEAVIMTWSVFVVPKGATNKDNAMKLLAHIFKVESQVAIATEYNYGPVFPKALEQLPPDRLNVISGGPSSKGKAVFLNADWWGANLQGTTEQFQKWLLG
jgi:putative spermidine/putrescine transport system substrate-binding protein